MTDDLEIHLIADSTGETAARIARAAVAQFPTRDFTLVRHRRMTTSEAVMGALDAVRARAQEGRPTAVMFTFVKEDKAHLVTGPVPRSGSRAPT